MYHTKHPQRLLGIQEKFVVNHFAGHHYQFPFVVKPQNTDPIKDVRRRHRLHQDGHHMSELSHALHVLGFQRNQRRDVLQTVVDYNFFGALGALGALGGVPQESYAVN
tara:strand:- start:1979 stop:2302 length:324 start_codon:yes stop_codon:yes gene_type:complete